MKTSVHVLIWLLGISFLGAGVSSLRAPSSSTSPPPSPPDDPAGVQNPVALSVDPQVVLDQNPFRLSRQPASLRLGAAPPEFQSEVTTPAPAPIFPPLVVHGIIGGPPWTLLLSGVPGEADQVVLLQGDSIGQITFLGIRADSILLLVGDSTVVLPSIGGL